MSSRLTAADTDDAQTTWDVRKKNMAKQAVRETLSELGIDSAHVFEMQKDFAWLRNARLFSQSVLMKAVLVFVGVMITGLSGLIVVGAIYMVQNGN